MPYPYDQAVNPGMGQPQPVQPQINPETGQPFSEAEMAQMAAMLGTYGDQLELGSLEGQQAQADALRSAQVPEGRSSGRVYTAANPLEVLGTIGQQYAGKRKADKIEKKGGKLRERIGANVKQYGLMGLGGGAKPTGVPASIAKPEAPPPSKLKIPEVY
jgi:hypothetical protein